MQTRPLGRTGLELTKLSFGASSLGQEFRNVDLTEATRSVRVAIDRGMNFIDTAAYYGRGLSECLLGKVLPDIPRDRYHIGSKLGRYTPTHFDFSPRRVAESIDTSLERMRIDHLDIIILHDLEFVDVARVMDETLPAVRREVDKGKVRFVGVSGYPMKIFQDVMASADIDCLLTYNHYTLQNDMATQLVPIAKAKGVGLMNGAPFAARLLTDAPLPDWHKATPEVRRVAAAAAAHARAAGSDIAKLALQFTVANEDFTTCIAGSANPNRVGQWVDWLDEPVDQTLMAEVREILKPIHNWFHIEGRPENNDGEVG